MTFDSNTALESVEQQLKPFMPGEQISEPESNPLVFPADIMGGAAGDYSDLYASYLEVPKPFLFLSHLTCLGSVTSGRLTVLTELEPQPRIFLIILGDSADDRKSTGINKTVELFRDTLSVFDVCYGVGSAEGLQARIKDAEGSGASRLLLVLDEFKQLISKCKIESSVLLPCINTLYESNHYESRTKNCEIVIRNAHLSVLAASTVDTYERTWDASFTDIGFNNRLFLVPGQGKKKFSLPAKVPESEKLTLKRQLGDILAFIGPGRQLDITRQGRAVYHEWYMNLEKSIHAKRLDTYALRFMSLFAANERRDIIDDEIVDKVTRLMDWQLEVRRLHDPIDADSAVAKVEEKIRRLLHTGPKSERDLKRSIHVDRTGLWPFTQALKNLSAGREISWDRAEKRYSWTGER